MSGEGKVVCVTGASGYIASWLVKLLLEHGYRVKATVRDPDDPKIKHLHDLDGAKERLQLFKANLLEEGSFDSAVDGCVDVFHTASPVFMTANDPRVMYKSESIKRVVITSSIASVIFNGKPLNPDVVVDETWFSDPAFCNESNNWYPLSKTLAEKAAWKFAEENGLDFVTLHPRVVIGLILQSTLDFSVEVIFNIINGSQTFPSPYRLVDVRDVALAHIQSLEVSTASGRYLFVVGAIHFAEILQILQENSPSFSLLEKFLKREQRAWASALGLGRQVFRTLWKASRRKAFSMFKKIQKATDAKH